MLMLSIVEDNSSRSEMDQNSGSKAIAIAKGVTKIAKVVKNVVIVELITDLITVQHMGKAVFSAKRKDISVHTANLARTANNVVIPSRHQHEVEQDDNGDDWTFSLNQDEVVIKFTDSVTKVKGSKNVMFDEIELSRVLFDLKVQAALKSNENCAPVPNNGCPLHKLRFKLDSDAHGNLMPIFMYKSLFPSLPHDVLRKSINKRVTLVAYNKQDIKQLGQCCINVLNMSTGKSKTCKFFVMGDCSNPIIGLHNYIGLNLLRINVPFTDKWTDKSCSFRADSIDVEEVSKEKLTHDFILKRYKKLFIGIGCFECAPAKIKLKANAISVQKPPRRIPVAMR